MATDKTDKTDATPVATSATIATRGRVSREAAYRDAVRLALAAIEAAKSRPRHDQHAAIMARLEAGQKLSPDDIALLRAAMAKPARARGRPRGSGAAAERWACRAAILATDLLRGSLEAYRNPASQHRLTLSDAIAEAMRLQGFRRLATYEAVAAEMRQVRRQYRAAKRTLLSGARQQIAFIRNAQPALAKVGPPILKALEKWKKSKAMLDDK
jgi:hypothetical protein